MRLTVVGCSGSYPGPDSPASCYLLEAEHGDGAGTRTWRVLLDLGNGALGALHRLRRPARRSTRCCSATCTPTTAWTSAATT